MQIIFLGTSCAVPTKDRNHATFLLTYRDEGILFDCGENVQRQLKIAGIKLTKITRILISHLHGDHVFGLPGIIYSLGLSEYNKKLTIYGPKGIKKFIENMIISTTDNARINIDIKEIGPGKFYDGKWFKLESVKLKHKQYTLGYSFIEKDRKRINLNYIKKLGIPEGPLLGKLQEGKDITFKGKKISAAKATHPAKGKKISFIADTLMCDGAYDLAKDADLLIANSTYASKDKDKAKEHIHLTAEEAGLIASQSNTKQLILTHFSQRYKDIHVLEQDARNVFDNSIAAKDFMKINL
jgi:ribonuclease Z